MGRLERRIAALPAADAPHAVWLLDVDGVLNALSGRCPGWPGQARAELRTFGGGVTELHHAPGLMRVLSLLHRRGLVEFRWLTTWEEDAPASSPPWWAWTSAPGSPGARTTTSPGGSCARS